MDIILIGVDPGSKTGLAIFSCKTKNFKTIKTCGIVEAMKEVEDLNNTVKFGALHGLFKIELYFEDARQRKWFGKRGDFNHQGVGSIKRDCNIWEEFCKYHGIKFKMIPPQKGATKWTPDYFKRITGWEGRTSEHARDAAALIYRNQ